MERFLVYCENINILVTSTSILPNLSITSDNILVWNDLSVISPVADAIWNERNGVCRKIVIRMLNVKMVSVTYSSKCWKSRNLHYSWNRSPVSIKSSLCVNILIDLYASGAVMACPSGVHEFILGFAIWWGSCVTRSLFHALLFFVCPLYRLSLDFRLLITLLVSSKFPYFVLFVL